MKRKLTCLFMVMVMIITVAPVTFAAENNTSNNAYSDALNGSNGIEMRFINDESEAIIIEPEKFEDEDAFVGVADFGNEKNVPDMDTDDSNALTTSAQKMRGSVGNPMAGTYTGTITESGGAAWLIVDVEPGEALFATLECPYNPQLDYDLYIYDYYSGQINDVSDSYTYFNAVRGVYKTVDEGCMAINDSTS